MAQICFTWELGQGYGHLVRYRRLIERLLAEGHAVTFLTKDSIRAAAVFEGMAIAIAEAPPAQTPTQKPMQRLNSYPELLFSVGFSRVDRLAARAAQWAALFAAIKPDLLVIDHSPTALLASRNFDVPRISSGSGFTVPPRAVPMRPFRYWSNRFREHLQEHENSVLKICNEVLLNTGMDPMDHLSELVTTESEWLMTYPELDHYGERVGANYLGVFSSTEFGTAPEWPENPGPNLFAYLATPAVPNEFAAAIEPLAANVCLFAPQLRAGEIDKLPVARVWLAPGPLDLMAVAASADAVVTNGGLNTVAAFLCAGLPQLVLPNNMERYMVGRRVEILGAGLMAPLTNPGDVAAKLRAILHDRSYRRAAKHFARRWASFTAEQQTDAMLADVRRLL